MMSNPMLSQARSLRKPASFFRAEPNPICGWLAGWLVGWLTSWLVYPSVTPKTQPRALQITRIQRQIRTRAVQTELTTHLSTSPLKQQHVYTGEMQQRLHTYTDAHKEMQPTFSTPYSFQTRSGTRNSYINIRLTTHTRTQKGAARASHMLTHTTCT